jgi:hypothetical protein
MWSLVLFPNACINQVRLRDIGQALLLVFRRWIWTKNAFGEPVLMGGDSSLGAWGQMRRSRKLWRAEEFWTDWKPKSELRSTSLLIILLGYQPLLMLSLVVFLSFWITRQFRSFITCIELLLWNTNNSHTSFYNAGNAWHQDADMNSTLISVFYAVTKIVWWSSS